MRLVELVDQFLNHEAPRRYVKHGRPTRQVQNMTAMLNHLLDVEIPPTRLFGRAATAADGCRRLRDVDADSLTMEDMEDYVHHCAHLTVRGDKPIAVSTVNKYRTGALTFFRWARRKKLLAPSVLSDLECAEPIQPGRTPARNAAPVQAARHEDLLELVTAAHRLADKLPRRTERQRVRWRNWKLIPYLLTIHMRTGARPGEMVIMRMCDCSTRTPDRECMLYVPESHKTEHKGHDRMILMDAEAEQAFCEAVDLNMRIGDDYAFGFATGFTMQTRLWPWKSGTADVAVNGYRNKLCDLIARSDMTLRIAPNQIRHYFATEHALIDLEGTRAQMGHRHSSTTRRYTHEDGRAAQQLFDLADRRRREDPGAGPSSTGGGRPSGVA